MSRKQGREVYICIHRSGISNLTGFAYTMTNIYILRVRFTRSGKAGMHATLTSWAPWGVLLLLVLLSSTLVAAEDMPMLSQNWMQGNGEVFQHRSVHWRASCCLSPTASTHTELPGHHNIRTCLHKHAAPFSLWNFSLLRFRLHCHMLLVTALSCRRRQHDRHCTTTLAMGNDSTPATC